jgi:Dienelactone hydrolase family
MPIAARLDWLSEHPKVAREKIGVVDFCIGGHLAFRSEFPGGLRLERSHEVFERVSPQFKLRIAARSFVLVARFLSIFSLSAR